MFWKGRTAIEGRSGSVRGVGSFDRARDLAVSAVDEGRDGPACTVSAEATAAPATAVSARVGWEKIGAGAALAISAKASAISRADWKRAAGSRWKARAKKTSRAGGRPKREGTGMGSAEIARTRSPSDSPWNAD